MIDRLVVDPSRRQRAATILNHLLPATPVPRVSVLPAAMKRVMKPIPGGRGGTPLRQLLTATTLVLGLAAPLASALAEPAATPIAAQVETLATQPIPIDASFPGSVVPSDYVDIAARTSGYVTGLSVDVGQSVKKGDLLLSVNPTEANADVEQAKAQLVKAQAAEATAKADYERFKDLYGKGTVTKQRFQQAELAYTSAQSDVGTAQAALDKARNQVGYSELHAPFDGVIFAKKVSDGQLVNPGQALLTLYDPDTLQIQVQVDDSAFARLRLGEQVLVEVDGAGGRRIETQARVDRLVDASDPVTHTHTVKLTLPAGSGAEGGAYARVMVPTGQEQALLVPGSAIHQRAGITGVFVAGADGKAEFRMVTLGQRRGDGQVVVLSGLYPGDRLILSAQGELANGVAVDGGRP